MSLELDPHFVLVLAIAVGILGSARLTRVITYDDYPPAEWVRERWTYLTRSRRHSTPERIVPGAWSKLVTCWWCATPYVTAGCAAHGYFTSLHWSWWAVWGVLGASYVAAMVIARDGDDGEE
jgi:hypothetical protein